MAKIKIAGNAAIITSDLKVEEIQKVNKFTTDGLSLKNEKGESIFGISCSGSGGITNYGVCYDSESTDGYAQVTIQIDNLIPATERQSYIVDKYATVIANLNALETYVRAELTNVDNVVNSVTEAIEVLD